MYSHNNLLIQGYLDLMKPERMYKQPSLRLIPTSSIGTHYTSAVHVLPYEEPWLQTSQINNVEEISNENSSNENNSSPSSLLELTLPQLSDEASPISLEFYDHLADPFFIDPSFDFPDFSFVHSTI